MRNPLPALNGLTIAREGLSQTLEVINSPPALVRELVQLDRRLEFLEELFKGDVRYRAEMLMRQTEPRVEQEELW